MSSNEFKLDRHARYTRKPEDEMNVSSDLESI